MATPLSAEEIARIRSEIPILSRTVREGRPLVYLDNGATSQKPQVVLDAERDFYATRNSAVHRGSHALAEEADEAFEAARATVARFIGGRPQEIVFTKNATEALNLVAYAFSNAAAEGAMEGVDPQVAERFRLGPGDVILITQMEHHANLVPWQELARRTGATLRWLGVTDGGELDLSDLDTLLDERVKVVAFTHVSNVLGTINPVRELTDRAHAVGALVVVDGAQAVPHLPVDVAGLGVDLYAFTGHKCLGPMGIGVLWGRYELLEAMPPFITGGSMIEVVRMEGSTYAPPPARFEAGVPVAAQAVALGVALEYLETIGMDRVQASDEVITRAVLDGLAARPWVRALGPTDVAGRTGCVSFVVDGVHPHDVGQVLDDSGVAVRTGHHCAWPLHRSQRIPASSRASFAVYTSLEDVEAFLAALDRVPQIFGIEV